VSLGCSALGSLSGLVDLDRRASRGAALDVHAIFGVELWQSNPLVVVSLFSRDVQGAGYRPDPSTWSGKNIFSPSQLVDVTRILPSGNRSMVKVTLSEVASFSMTLHTRSLDDS
jgi:hypothetical protein